MRKNTHNRKFTHLQNKNMFETFIVCFLEFTVYNVGNHKIGVKEGHAIFVVPSWQHIFDIKIGGVDLSN